MKSEFLCGKFYTLSSCKGTKNAENCTSFYENTTLIFFIWLVYCFSVPWTSLPFITYGCTEANLGPLSYLCQGPETYHRWGKGKPGGIPLDRMPNPGSLVPSQNAGCTVSQIHTCAKKSNDWCGALSQSTGTDLVLQRFSSPVFLITWAVPISGS